MKPTAKQTTSPADFLSSRRPFLLALLFAVLFTAFEESTMQSLQGQAIFLYFATFQGKTAAALTSTLLTFFAFALLFWFSFSFSWGGRGAFLLLFGSILIIQYGYFGLFHRFLSSGDISTALKSPPHLWNTAAQAYFNKLALVPIGLYLLAAPWVRPPARPCWKLAGAACLFISVNLLIPQIGWVSHPGNSVFKFFSTTSQWIFDSQQRVERKNLPAFSAPTPTNNIVLIVDESIRSDHLSLNGYERPTTPYLEELSRSGWVTNWGTAVSGGTCSIISNSLLVTGVRAKPGMENQEIQQQIATFPTLLQYAKRMGYTTYYLDVQSDYLWNGFETKELLYIDHWIHSQQFSNTYEADFDAAGQIRQVVTQSTGNFILLNKNGLHFLYQDQYPEEAALWRPLLPKDSFGEQQPDLAKNDYDNGIRYNLENFFRTLIPPDFASMENTVYLYTSDHGQTLFEQGQKNTHCGTTPAEASVPLLMIGKLPAKPNTAYPASHANIFATLLDLMNVPAELRIVSYAPSLLSASPSQAEERYYLSGDMELSLFDPSNLKNISKP